MSRIIIWLITNLSDPFSLFVTIALSNVPLFDLNLCKPSHFNTWENYFAIGRFQIAAAQSPSVFSQRCKYEILRQKEDFKQNLQYNNKWMIFKKDRINSFDFILVTSWHKLKSIAKTVMIGFNGVAWNSIQIQRCIFI